MSCSIDLRNDLVEGVQVSPTLDFNPVRESGKVRKGSRYGFKGSKVQGIKNTLTTYYTVYTRYNSVIYTFKFRKSLTPFISDLLQRVKGVKIKGCSLNQINGEVTTHD